MNFGKWICLLVLAVGTLLTPTIRHWSNIATPQKAVLADGTAPPAPPIPYGKTVAA